MKRLDHPRRPIAETHRRLGVVADAVGLPRPSYEQTRVLVHALRRRKRSPGPGEILLDVALRARPPEAMLDALEAAVTPPPP